MSPEGRWRGLTARGRQERKLRQWHSAKSKVKEICWNCTSEQGELPFSFASYNTKSRYKKRILSDSTGLEKIRRYTLEIKYYFVPQNDTV